jgi:4-amino-4-deoxy-L-arabinose transferase-like glycosyltransferase
MDLGAQSRPRITTAGWLLIVAGIATIQRLLMWALYPVVTLGDTGGYRRSAEAILGGWVQYDGTRTPGYPAFLALAGPDNQVYLAQLALGLAITLLFFYVGWRMTGRAWFGALAGLLYTFNAGQFFFEANLMTETVATFFVALSCAGVAFLLGEPRSSSPSPSSTFAPGLRAFAVALLIGLASGLAALTRPLFVFLPFWIALCLLVFWQSDQPGMRLATALAALVPGLILLGLWVNFIHSRFHVWSMSAMQGFHMIQHTGGFFEYVPDQYAAVRDTYLKYRAAHVAEYGTQVNTIWDAIPELQQVSGEGFYGLSRLIQAISIQLIIAHPLLYLRNVGLGWLWFWKVPVYWSPEAFASPVLQAGMQALVQIERGLLFAANLAFIAGSLLVVSSKAWRRRLNVTSFVWFMLGMVWIASLLQTLLDHGDNPRFSVPVQTPIVLIAFYWLWNLWQWRRARA